MTGQISTIGRLSQWVGYWSAPGMVDDKGPRRPADVGVYHDRQLQQVAMTVAAIERERGR